MVSARDVSGSPQGGVVRRAGDWTQSVVFCAGTAWNGNRFPDQHIAERLTKWAPVIYVDPPLSPLSPRRDPSAGAALAEPRLRLVTDRLARLTPVVAPGKGRRGMRAVTGALTRMAIRRAVRELGADVEVTVAASLLPVFGAAGERRRVLYATDDFAAGAALMAIDDRWLRRRQAKAIAQADVVVVVSLTLADTCRAEGIEPVVVENGVDDVLFAGTDEAPLPDDVRLAGPIAGFVGHLSNRIDVRLLEAVAESGVSLLLVGPRQSTFELARLDGLLARPNVQWVGAKPFAQLPRYLRAMRVGLLPYADSEFNRASSPLKVLEYLAAGRPAVVTDLPATRPLGDLVHTARSPVEFAAAVQRALAAPDDPVQIAARRSAARQRSWDVAARHFATAVGIT